MTDDNTDGTTYSLDAQPTATNDSAGGNDAASEASDSESEAMGVPIPDEHVGAFVAEAFEDPERTTDWEEIVDAMVAPDAREAWQDLSPVEQTVEVLKQAAEYDRRATDELERIPTNRGEPTPAIRESFDEATRLRRNADAFRDGVAAAYADGWIDDEDLLTAVDRAEFDTRGIARREDALESVTTVYDFDYRPYGGTLFDEEESPERDADSGESGIDPDVPETF